MASNKERGNIIRQQILRDVKHHPKGITKHIANIFLSRPKQSIIILKDLKMNIAFNQKE